MTDYINECNGCADGCRNCGRDHTEVTRCDECGEVCEKVYKQDGRELCEDCAGSFCDERYEDLPLCDKMSLFGWDLDEFQTRTGAEVEASRYWYSLDLTDKMQFINSDELIIEEG